MIKRSSVLQSAVVVRMLVIVVFLSILTTVQPLAAVTPAAAAPVTDFEPGNIISDAVMYDSASMNAAAVQTFLNARGSSCAPASGNTCVKDYRENTPSRAADALCTRGYTGGSNETAATIIAKVSVACGINPQVLIVTLQKEQGLITATAGKSARTYARALGFGCPDNVGGWCDPQYAGFANQVYSAAKQLKRYASNPNGYSYRAGRTNTILWHPTASCGSTQVYIQNQATASLYNYTPYVPNAAALAAGYGSGDGCSSYGNRNFHLYFQSWFGSATGNRPPIGSIDAVQSSSASTIRVRGWALDPDTSAPISVHVYVDGRAVKSVLAEGSRPDVAAAYGRGPQHGFDVTVAATSGSHAVCVYAIDSASGTNPSLGCNSVVVTNARPLGSLDRTTAAPGSVVVSGWALDPDTTSPINVHVFIDGKLVQGIRADGARPDVERIYGKGSAHGYSRSLPASDGVHQVCVYAIDSERGPNPQIGCAQVTVRNERPMGAVDSITSPSPGQVRIRGWAFDPDSSAPITTHVIIDGRARAFTANGSRPDVARVYGVGDQHGLDISVPVRSGTHDVCVYAIDATAGPNPKLGCQTVVVNDTPAQGGIDSASATAARAGQNQPYIASSVSVSGWAWDFDLDGPVTVRVMLDGALAETVTADEDHAVISPADRRRTGFSVTIDAPVGPHEVCVEAVDPGAGTTALGCTTQVVDDTLPFGAYDSATSAAPGKIRLRGWTADANTTAPVMVHARVGTDGVIGLRADKVRPDLNFGLGTAHGFDDTLPGTYAPGTYTVCLFAINQPDSARHTSMGCKTVTVP
jgi:hypothetical protein